MRKIDRIIHKIIEDTTAHCDFLILEYDKVNIGNYGDKLLPWNKYRVSMYVNDHNPPHFHIITNDGWNIKFLISNGFIDSIENRGKKKSELQRLSKIVPKWLTKKSVSNPSKTNQQVLNDLWIELHSTII